MKLNFNNVGAGLEGIANAVVAKKFQDAANVQPRTIENTSLTETTPGAEDMVYDSDTGTYLPKYLQTPQVYDSDTGQMVPSRLQPAGLTPQAQDQLNGGASPEGLRPTFDAKTTKQYQIGNNSPQDTPIRPEQLRQEQLARQSDVAMRLGMTDKAIQLQGLVKGQREEDTTNQIRLGATEGLKNTKDAREEEKQFAITKGMYETAVRLGRPDLAAGYYQQMMQSRDGLLSRANDRADRVFRTTGNISGYVDNYNKYFADGQTIDETKKNPDGSHTFTINDGTGQTRDVSVPKEKMPEYLQALRDPKILQQMEQQRAKSAFDAQLKMQEELGKPQKVGKDESLVIPSTGQTWQNPRAGRFDVKEANPVLDDARKMILERTGNYDMQNGRWNWSPDAVNKAQIAERLFMKNPTLTPAMMAEIADKGTTGTATVEIGGRQQRVPAVSHNGRTYILGGSDAGQATVQPEMVGPPASLASTPKTIGLGTRSVTGKIGPVPGLQKDNPAPVAYNSPEFDNLAVQAATESGIPPKLLLAIKNAGEKSNNDQVSEKGAAGVMQFIPATAKAYGIDPKDPAQAIKGAGSYMADLIKQYGGNVAAAVAHYNGGSSQGQLVAAGQQPSYPETRAYLARVMNAL